ncbi:hypothetical protein DMB92_04475 [Campylobacter sp. MIT 99-7217]|uniref:ABC-type transport auxiliary lipoprotein family protein n=1 Tax=Campylobacter sp. MIT 99-7217 TaxID=535091 RepID=UPI00115C2680|nr:ABC-type transport auxiliary lipoprotein family protein [Campylobacter sp. MIT 99-7217]TQR32359.1 hypothetical protein DMB92_04475 [Campylobacter sp. MIT 99-7217]
MKYYILIALLSFAFSACSLKPEAEAAPTIINLSPNLSSIKFKTNKSIKIALPQSTFYLRSTKIAFIKNQEFGTYANHRFQNSPNDLIFTLLSNNLEKAQLFKAVTNANFIKTDLLLESRIYAFEQIFEDDLSYVKIELGLNLIDLKAQSLIANKYFAYKIPLKQNDENALANAFEEALSLFLKDVLIWCKQSLEK